MDIGTPIREEGRVVLDEIPILLEEDVNRIDQVQHALVGKVIADRPLNKAAIKNMLLKAWGDIEDVQISDVGLNLFLFTFNKEEESQRIFAKAPWFVMNKLISLQRWNAHVSMNELRYNKVQFWVQIQGLPLEFLTVQSADKILSMIGEIQEIENPMVEGKIIRHFIRARVEIDIQHPLSTGCWVPRRNMSRIWVCIKYERLQDLCFKCGVIGHEQKNCLKEKVMSSLRSDVQRYGPRVGVAPAKSIKFILAEQVRRKKQMPEEAGSSSAPVGTEEKKETTAEKELAIQEILENRERFVYEEALEAMEGDGNLPDGWKEVRDDSTLSPTVTEHNQRGPYPPKDKVVSPQMFFSNLRFRARPTEGGGEHQQSPGEVSDQRYGYVGPSSSAHGGLARDVEINQRQKEVQWAKEKSNHRSCGPSIKDPLDIQEESSQGVLLSKEKKGGHDNRRPDWWAQEQIDNKAAYEKLQLDLQTVREEVKFYWEGSGNKGLVSDNTNSRVESPQESYDPTDPVIPIDYTSLQQKPFEYQGINLTLAEISKCKKECMEVRGKKRVSRVDNISRSDDGSHGRLNNNNNITAYTVQFPNDEEEVNQVAGCRLAMEEENSLAIEVAQSLNLKRGREECENLQTGQFSDQGMELATPGKSRKQGINDWVGLGLIPAQQTVLLLKAEEAGQSTPPNLQ